MTRRAGSALRRNVNLRLLAGGLIPLAVVALLVMGLWQAGVLPWRPTRAALAVREVRLPEPGLLLIEVTNRGTEPRAITRLTVDGDERRFRVDPAGAVPPQSTALVRVPFLWSPGSTYRVRLTDDRGATADGQARAGAPSGPWLPIGLIAGLVALAAGSLVLAARGRLRARPR